MGEKQTGNNLSVSVGEHSNLKNKEYANSLMKTNYRNS
jgi:hypothetical protein